ncbi:MAG: molybdopterin converting factor, subunit 1 [Moraxellaceae bacterium]|jgi:molybdopterin synthase sulfur carrier subunit|nr:molybdopterin converting factor, subunit 1 [Moraxellaceae bacterium]
MNAPGTITVLYFAKFREQLGCSQEALPLPAGSSVTVQEVLAMLAARDERHGELLGCDRGVLMAVNQAMVQRDRVLQAGDELALFPPVTGG